MKSISEETRLNILLLLDMGHLSCQIEEELNVGRRKVDKICIKARPNMETSQEGRPPKLTETNKQWLARNITSGNVDNASQLTQVFKNITGVNISTNAVRRALKEV